MVNPQQPVAVLFGTRPEAIKLAPVIHELRTRGVPILVITTGQHREMVDQVLELFDIRTDHDLRLMRHGAGLDELLSRAVVTIGEVLRQTRPAALVVQGDTTSTLAAAMAAFHAKVPVAHVEAGLRSGDMTLPFPEEMNRRVVSVIARWNFAPTQLAADNLLREGHRGHVEVTGNTVVDAVQYITGVGGSGPSPQPAATAPYILATAHRRESWGAPIEQVALGLGDVLEQRPEVSLIFATHPNPLARDPVNGVLGGHPRTQVVDALDYRTFLRLLQGAALVVSDSGGVQEEGPTLGVPVLVTRTLTERPEGLSAGAVRLVGTDRQAIRDEALRLLGDPALRREMAAAGRAVYGDGHAAGRILDTLLHDLGEASDHADV